MRLHRSALLASVAPLALAFALASCGGGGETPTTPTNNNNNGTGNPPGGGTGNPPGGGGGPPSSAAVTVNDGGFSPGTVVIAKSGTVTWTWSGGYGTAHNVTFTADGDASNDQTEGTFSKTFPNTGVFGYKCTNHPAQMSGTVDVR